MVVQLAKRAIHSILHEAEREAGPVRRAEMVEWARQSEPEQSIRTMISLVEHEPDISVRQKQLGANPVTLNVLNGTFNLKNGRWSPYIRMDFITSVVPVEIAEVVLAGDKGRLSDVEPCVEVTNR